MCEVQELLNGLCQTFGKYRMMRQQEMVQILNKVRCCDCGHKMRLDHVRSMRSGTIKSQTKCRSGYLLAACFAFLILILFYMILVARRYNHVRAYGSSACGSTFFYTSTDCDVSY
ncbi:uncharacterized protein LOC108111727 [Drosophila eugracilis]|uniref:uncharacterized protein LOC108111727 n=1 Tax=Drosophila eugracilis TaxID=29029 RepID=UPI001BDA9AB7|nr:uncharacterized protein LOC108111727 [Drosophila eugracilis]